MAALTTDNFAEIAGPLIREIMRAELMPIIQDVQAIRHIVGRHSMELKELRVDVGSLKTAYRHQSVLLEDLDSRFTTLAEAVDQSLDSRQQGRDHEGRLAEVETNQNSIKAILAAHNARYKNK